MAEAVAITIGTSLASGLLKSLMQKSVNVLSQSSLAGGLKSALSGNLEKQLADLKRELEKLDDLLCRAERMTPAHHNRNALLHHWLGSIKDAVNFADNLLDDISYEQIRMQVESNTLLLPRSVASLTFPIKIGRKLNKCMSMIADIYKEAEKMGLSLMELVANPSSYQPPAANAMSADLREIRENVDTSVVVGREDDEELIVDKLCCPNNDEVLEVIAIVGMSGVGKTTLTRKIYDNDSVTEQYKNKIWIFVSDDFDLRRILAEMLQSLTTGVNTDASLLGVPNKANVGAMEKRLKECLEKERYLLVLDDVWNTDKLVWDSIRTSLVRVANGCTGTSMVLVTTQVKEVASVMGASLNYDVKLLSKDDSWKLFKSKAFLNKSLKQESDLKDIGERILKKCGGLPLAINTLASLLATMNERSQWESVERNQLWNLAQGQTTIMPWLLLSFNHLPEVKCPGIKQCFSLCSICIPKGTGVSEVRLISSWIVQGFIQLPETSHHDWMAIGRPYIKSMLAHGLLQLYSDDGNEVLYSLHDIIRDLADYVSKASSRVEHVRINGGSTFPNNTQSTLRTLICGNATISIDLVVQASFLRHLELIDCGLKEIPGSIGRLKHLRKLLIKDNPIKYLPDSIGSLYNLEVLALLGCHRDFELPQQITKLLNLRLIGTTKAVHIPKGLGQLTRLTWVPSFKLKAGDGCRIKELGSLKHLVGVLMIKQLENISSKEDIVGAGLENKAGIEVMNLEWSSEGNEGDIICTNDEEVMEGLQPHSNLKRLWVGNFRGKRLSVWLSSGLYCINLTKLTLLNCRRCEQLPTLGCLPCLNILVIEGMESVEVIGSDFFACSITEDSHNDMSQSNLFPCLKEFTLWNMPKLKEWFDPSGWSCASAFPCLERLKITNCPLLVSVPSCFHSLQDLCIVGINSSQPLLMILSNSYKLTSLWVAKVQQLTCLSEPLLKCPSLRLLRITGCKDLVELPPTLQSMGCLGTLIVESCDSLTSLPCIEGLLSLRVLEISGCNRITDTPCGIESCVFIETLTVQICSELNFNPDMAISSNLRYLSFHHLSKQMSVERWLNHLTNLAHLTIGGFNNELDNFRGIEYLPSSLKSLCLIGWPKLKSLPDEVESLTQLETLWLCEFDGVTALPEWLGSLSSLQFLQICHCKYMKHLPSLDAMRRLTRLGELKILLCRLLEERCRKEGGEEWHKISHIPRIRINEEDAADDAESSELVEAKKEVESALRVTIGTSLASALLKALIQKSANVLSESSTAAVLLGNLESQLADLKQQLEKLDALLCSAERLPPAHHNRSALLLEWLGDIKKAANFADNLLDDISYEQIRRQTESNKIGRKLNKCMSMIAKIYKEAAKIGLKPVELVENLRGNVDTSGVVGREADEELIVTELCQPKNEEVLGVIAIVGMSGIGKTTLARKIYHNEIVTEQYKNKVWISMTDYFNTDALEKKLNCCLEKERYLLVLDDVRNVNQQLWDSMKTLLVRVADGCIGSSMVLATTQLQDVGSLMGASLTHRVNILSNYYSRVLFERKAFANKSSKQVSDLRDIGEMILSNCGGFPLAINTLASLLTNMNERSQWESVSRSQVWNLVNFNLLPSAAIKRCFAHCSILISKGAWVEGGFLIASWFAQGFIQLPETSDQDFWTIGQLYIKSMCNLGLLQVNSDDDYNQRFTMHDHIHDFAVYVSGDEYLTIREPDDLQKASSGVEHVLIHGGSTFNSQLNFPKGNAQSTLRTLLCSNATISIDLVGQARFLRQLELRDCGLKEFPRSIGRLKHLRILSIKDNSIKCLPESIGSLYNLQELRLSELPQQVTKLLNLRHIYTDEVVHMPKGLGQLTRLLNVPRFKLKAGDGCRIKELGSLKYLLGTLSIKQLENISCKEDAMEADLKRKAGIETMNLEWSSEGNEGDIICTNDEEVMEGLQPHSNLKQLWVKNFRGKRLSVWLSSGLYCINLTNLTLLNCKRCEQLPTLGCLPCLKRLHIDGMESVEVIGSDFFACSSTGSSQNDTSHCNLFPSLEDFTLLNMPKLKGWFDPSGSCASAFPCLKILNISNCHLLVSVPSCFHSLQGLRFEGMNSGEPLLLILSNSYKLTSLWVKNVQQLSCLSEPLLKCTSLRLLEITDCKDLVELPPTLQSMGCLETLIVRNCDSLTSLPCIEGLLSLRVLEISGCNRITDTPCGIESCVFIETLTVQICSELNFNPDMAISSNLRYLSFHHLSKQMSVERWLNHLTNLAHLTIGGFNNELDNFRGIEYLPSSLKSLCLIGWPKLKSLPDEVESLTQLETLWLYEFDGVTALPEWLGSLSSLQFLQICHCKYMKHLPSLDAMRRLTRLGELKIEECRLLEERCRKEGGEEWHKISHIPRIRINEEDAADDAESSELVGAKKEVESALRVTIGTSLASALLKALIQKSANVLSESSSAAVLLGNLESQLADLKQQLEKLDALLCSAERLPPAHHNRSALLLEWLGDIKKAANFADNLLDDISYEQIRRQTECNTVSNLSLPSSVGSVGFCMKIGRKLNKCMSMIAKIYKEAAKIGLKPVELVDNLRENVDTSGVVGRQADEELIVTELCQPKNNEVLGVIAIVGMSGIGKTTLARKIYHNEIVTEQYKNKVWISMTDYFNTDALEKKLNCCLEKERYLLVLDDVRNVNQQLWDSMKTLLVRVADGCIGSSMVLATTQLQDVGSLMGASLTHRVNILSNYYSRVLFERKAFANKSSKQVSDLRDIGEMILSNCGGFPLAINTLASLLTNMNERSQWESVFRSQVWNLLNFNLLSSAAIKRCFAHCSILISKGKTVAGQFLISSWFAQGFIQLSETSAQEFWTIGRLYIKSMCDLGLLQLYSDDGNNQHFTMDDHIHDLAVYVSGDECLTIREPDDLQKASSGVEHVLIHGGSTFNSQLNFPKGNSQSTLRTLLCRNATISIDLVVQARFLRQLELEDCGLKEFPKSIGRLKHLRKLFIKDNPIKYLPDSIGSLYNLQVLVLLGCHRDFELPQQITKLLNLRLIATTEAVHIPKGLGQLTRLTSVPRFKLKAGDGCRIKELGSLKYLMGTLSIKQLENISCKEDAMEADLKRKAGIEIMVLGWSSEGNEGDIIGTNDEEVMEGLQPHSNLKNLWVKNFRGKRLSVWLSSGLYCINLTKLTLLNCKRCEQLPTLGCLRSLKLLRIDGMESVEVIGSDFFACSSTGSSQNDTSHCNLFPSLEDFKLLNMPKLKGWFDPSGTCASAFPCLEKLKISNCPLLVSVPSCFHSLQDLHIGGMNSGQPLLEILSNSYKLTSLKVKNVQQLICLSEPMLKCTSLRILRIIGCKDLVELPPTLQSLACLETLIVRRCDSLTSVPDIEGLLSLRNLTISACQQITDTDMEISSRLQCLNFHHLSKQMSVPRWLNHLSNLSNLTIGGFNNELDNICGIEHLPKSVKSLYLIGWPKLKSLPDKVQSLTQLETLRLYEFDGVIALPEWLGKLSSLQSLQIKDCNNMKHLPSLDVMRRFTQLRELVIIRCPLLEERCRKEGGEEWHKISHIPKIQIKR